MSWLSTVGAGAQALRQGARQVRERLRGGAAPPADHGAELEQQVRAAATPAEREEISHAWAARLAHRGGDPALRRALLRTGACEALLEAAALDHRPGAVGGLRMLLTQVLDCPELLRSDLLQAAAGGGELLGEQHVAWLVRVLGALKADAREEARRAERHQLSQDIEHLAQELEELDAHPDLQGKSDKSFKLRARQLEVSGELLDVYAALRQSIEEAKAYQGEVQERREEELVVIGEEATEYSASLQSPGVSVDERHRALQAELQESHEITQTLLQEMDTQRADADASIMQLEEQKRGLKVRLDEVSHQLAQAQIEQRSHLEQRDEQRRIVDAIEAEFRAEIQHEEALVSRARHEQRTAERLRLETE
ncbi:unnamed protein product [Prorocentrum cordatum]|uniref:Uncharacterized protein n=1 Tax=Prorocentrum cordatum TaxID=2364126 RepID=A0ABN9WU88_9DINO|nr:unnamed protein product [Polarella glacialis]